MSSRVWLARILVLVAIVAAAALAGSDKADAASTWDGSLFWYSLHAESGVDAAGSTYWWAQGYSQASDNIHGIEAAGTWWEYCNGSWSVRWSADSGDHVGNYAAVSHTVSKFFNCGYHLCEIDSSHHFEVTIPGYGVANPYTDYQTFC
jgi:hypothetical protein